MATGRTPGMGSLELKGFKINKSKILGEGQYSVYEATKHGIKYAAKFLHNKDIADLRDNELFLFDHGRGHPNVLQVENYCAAEPIGSWIFTEYCEYGNLADYSRTHSRDFHKNETKHDIMIQVTSGLDFLHRQNKIHRDIKPGNILVTMAAGRHGNILIKLSDFGESRTLDRTMSATAVGTPYFAAPEIFDQNIRGRARQNNKIDIFSLGLTFLAIIQDNPGLIPIGEGLTRNDLIGLEMLRNRSYKPVKPKSSDDNFSRDMKGILLKMLIYDVTKRISAADTLQALRNIQTLPVSALTGLKQLSLGTIEMIEFKQIRSNQTQLMEWGKTKSTVLSTGDIVIYGRETESTPPALYIYTAGGQYKNTLPRVCKHEEDIYLLALNIQGQEYLCVSCAAPPPQGCGQIYTINIKTGKVDVAYQRDGHYPGQMCTGQPGVLYVHHCKNVKDRPILELDCSRLPFTHTGRTIQSGIENMVDMCYSSHPQPGMLIFSSTAGNKIRAVSVDTGTKLWELTKSEIEGRVIYPCGITVNTVNNYVIVCDGTNNRLLVLRSHDGKVINTHHVENCDAAYLPFLINNEQQLVMIGLQLDSNNQWKYCIFLFQIK